MAGERLYWAIRYNRRRVVPIVKGSPSLDSAISVLESLHYGELPINLLEDYTSYGATNSYAVYSEKSSSAPSSRKRAAKKTNKCDLSRFRRQLLENTADKIAVLEWNLSYEALGNEVKTQLFSNNSLEYATTVSTFTHFVDLLRRAVHCLKFEEETTLDEVLHVQPIVIVLLEFLLAKLHSTDVRSIEAAQPTKLSTRFSAAKITLSGHTDVLGCTRRIGAVKAVRARLIKFILELKRPFDSLYHGLAASAKDQLLAELETLARMCESDGGGNGPLAGVLTDLFTSALVVRVPTEEGTMHYLARRTTSSHELVLQLLALFLDYNTDVLRRVGSLGQAVPTYTELSEKNISDDGGDNGDVSSEGDEDDEATINCIRAH